MIIKAIRAVIKEALWDERLANDNDSIVTHERHGPKHIGTGVHHRKHGAFDINSDKSGKVTIHDSKNNLVYTGKHKELKFEGTPAKVSASHREYHGEHHKVLRAFLKSQAQSHGGVRPELIQSDK